jgi:hypothetical protein
VIFLGVAKAAMGHHSLPGGVVAGAGAEKLCCIGFCGARAVVVIELGRVRFNVVGIRLAIRQPEDLHPWRR